MPIQNSMELEAVLNRVHNKLDKNIAERGSWPVLEDIRRFVQQVQRLSRQPAQLKPLRETLRKASETIATEVPNDGAFHDDMWDIEDYFDYRT